MKTEFLFLFLDFTKGKNIMNFKEDLLFLSDEAYLEDVMGGK